MRELEPADDGLILHTDDGEISAAFVIWACGQFGTPSDGGLIGAEHARVLQMTTKMGAISH
ncbi:hypothetical protein DPM13_16340 [Paracoccus mutanolyticus]|uniref:FAD/NAD(P)-binding domain-containing protein n=1 Tax=Paracoccus mutanolyticus TaxID=1499308 RepID=A0ABN5M7Y4_9RHOB|nr:hypothetical protein [Paracoccus mutanolyticus]AWX93992.1 hypothetical protein DPM13_16340 [Paracoccus mutanolyticus]